MLFIFYGFVYATEWNIIIILSHDYRVGNNTLYYRALRLCVMILLLLFDVVVVVRRYI